MYKAVFLDRDGVINDNAHAVNKPEDLVLYPDAAEAIKQLNDAGLRVFVVTNQGGVGCGFMTEASLNAIHAKMEADLALTGAKLTAIAACIHHPNANCTCRKPKPGLIKTLVDKHNIDLTQSWLVGDRSTDCEAGKAAGVAKCIMLRGETEWADYTAKDLCAAVKIILGTKVDRSL